MVISSTNGFRITDGQGESGDMVKRDRKFQSPIKPSHKLSSAALIAKDQQSSPHQIVKRPQHQIIGRASRESVRN